MGRVRRLSIILVVTLLIAVPTSSITSNCNGMVRPLTRRSHRWVAILCPLLLFQFQLPQRALFTIASSPRSIFRLLTHNIATAGLNRLISSSTDKYRRGPVSLPTNEQTDLHLSS